MANRQQFKQSTEERRRRNFSEDVKRKKVREIEQKIISIAEVSRQYDIRPENVSRWLSKYSNNHMKGVRTIVESDSDIKRRGGSLPVNTIFHSDGGGQYYDKGFITITNHYQMIN